ncbi:MAG: hypothetical protein UW11_C0047G0002 [Parcubacteria group bacterium GW2011_GWA2_43_9b]|nr:MAG: hypothetical protein UW11_C0047G0002 [Parcubacteria group bacterium GW2011_GWA2_43_9b]
MRNRQFTFTPKIEYKLVAERSEANLSNLQFPTWCAREESNLDLKLRKLMFYPLDYGRFFNSVSISGILYLC